MLANGTVHIVPSVIDVFLSGLDFPIYILRGRFCPVCLLCVCRVHFKDICAHAFPGTLDTEPAAEQWQLPIPLMATLQGPSTINLFVMCMACVLFRITQGESNIMQTLAGTSIRSLWRLFNLALCADGLSPRVSAPRAVPLAHSSCLPQKCLQLQILLVHLYALNWCEIMAPAECRGAQRMMLSDTNCSLILSGGIIANLQSNL